MTSPSDPHDRVDAAESEERVKPCLQCGAILPFQQDSCSVCGANTRGGSEDEAVKPCLTCSELIPEADFFCPRCGDFALAIPADASNVAAIGSFEGGPARLLSRLVAVVIAVGGLALAVAGIAEFLELRRLLAG